MKKKFLIVAIIGPDGSGKTLLINYLQKKFNKINLKTERIHLKPSLFIGCFLCLEEIYFVS